MLLLAEHMAQLFGFLILSATTFTANYNDWVEMKVAKSQAKFCRSSQRDQQQWIDQGTIDMLPYAWIFFNGKIKFRRKNVVTRFLKSILSLTKLIEI